MVPITALWLPILLSAVIVFVASSLIHMVLPFHKNDYRQLHNEQAVLDSLRAASVTAGRAYFFPYTTHKEMKSPEMKEKFNRGPVGWLIVAPSGLPAMGKYMAQWFLLRGDRHFCRIPDWPHASTGQPVPGDFPGSRHYSILRVCRRAGSGLDLEGPDLGRDDQARNRRSSLRPADCRHLWLALASVEDLITARSPQLFSPSSRNFFSVPHAVSRTRSCRCAASSRKDIPNAGRAGRPDGQSPCAAAVRKS